MQNEMYDFDLNGNRKTAKIQDKNESYQTGEYNRLLSDENYRYEYDQEGNRISKIAKDNTTTKYFWDHRNRLTKVQTPTESVEYIYDYQNRLVKRIQNKTETHFVHDVWQIILQFENKEIKPTHRYLWGTKQDELIGNNNNWTLGDHLNTIRDIVKSDGTVISHLEYNAFGKLISDTKNDPLSFAYTGKLFDKISDLQWNINRWYDSNIGKWISDAPIGFRGSDWNLLRYVKNSLPLKFDTQGLLAKKMQYNAYIKNWNWPLPTTIVVHFKFDVTLECCGKQVLVRDFNVPSVVVNYLDKATPSTTVNIVDFVPPGQNSNTGKIITTGGGATDGDMPGWTVGFNAGGVLGAILIPIPPTDPSDAILVPIGSIEGTLAGGIFELIFDDEIIWFFSWKIKAYCESNQYNVWVLNISSSHTEEYHDNDWDDYYTDYTESSSFVMPN
jgi:RHS repeat-associated protein